MVRVSASKAYGGLLIAAILISIYLWIRRAQRDERLILIYIAALAGAFMGAKLVYLAAEGWLHGHDTDRWMQWATGKSILGGLLGGYAGVEFAKKQLCYTSTTGDVFAVITPLSIMLGRIGCMFQGCCLGRPCRPAWFTVIDATGVARWPAAQLECVFNAIALGIILWLKSQRILVGQLFHGYLIAYGLFRFTHEFFRDTPRIAGPFSGYHVAALAVFLLGAIRFRQRQGVSNPPPGMREDCR